MFRERLRGSRFSECVPYKEPDLWGTFSLEKQFKVKGLGLRQRESLGRDESRKSEIG